MFGSPDNPREKRDMEERWETLNRRHRILGVALLLLALTVGGGGWYAYQALQRHDMAPTQFPVVQKVVDAIGDQVKQTDHKLASWADDQQSLRDQIAKLGQKMEVQVARVTTQAQVSSAEMYRRVQAQIDDRLQRVDTRLTRIESSSEIEQTRVAELQRELAEMRSQAGRQADDLAAIRSKMDESSATNQRQLAGLQQSEEADRHDVDTIEHKLAVHRVDFEVTKNHSRELAEGISLGVTSTDVAHRYVSGWMWVMPDRRTIWLKNQNASQPVVFYSHADGKRRELVINNVTKGSVTGYLLLPGESGPDREIASARSSD
jgi:chaperonin cofactor prefoldin